MASLKQTIANRLNSLKSTGPRSEAGKRRSCVNSLKHGLSRIGTTPPAVMADAIANRKEQLCAAYRPAGPAQELAFERLCAESVRLDACERRILVARAEAAERAIESWDDDRAVAVAEQADRLAARPEVIQPRLLQSRHGVLWLIDRWDEVADSLRRCGGWTPEVWGRAMDLLGVSALARQGSGPWDLDPEDKGAEPGLDLARESVEALRGRLESFLDARDARSRANASAGLGAEESPELRRLERYAADARRQVARARAELQHLQADAAPAPSSRPASPPTPARPAVAPPMPARNPDPPPASAPPNTPPAPVSSAASPASTIATTPLDRTSPKGSLVSSLRDRLPSSSPATNRRTRRAQAALARRS